MMFTISPLLALISLLAVPASIGHGAPHRAPLAEAVRRPVGEDRDPQRAHRGDAHRARDREAVRAPAARRSTQFDRRERGAVPGELQGPVHLRDHPAGDDVHLEPQLRRDLRHRRDPGGQRPDEPRRRPGVHPVLAPVHDADHPGGLDRQRPPVRGRVRRAGVRAAGRGRGDPGPGRPARAPRPGASAGSPSRTSRSATSPTSRSSRTSTSSSSPARPWPSSARPAPARRRS